MDVITILLIGVPLIAWLWLTILGTLAAKYDSTLEPFQKKAQIVIVWIIPFFGAALVLFMVNQHSPDAIPRSWVPWPFRSLIFGKPRPRNKNRDNNEDSGIDLAISEHQHHSHHDGGGGIDGGGGD